MPTYQYTCKACGEPLEAVQSFHDAPLTECPHCGGELRKVFSSVGVVFKGSGFYRNDSRSTSKSGAGASTTTSTDGGSKGGASSSSSGSGSGGGDSKSSDSGSAPAKTETAAKPAASKGSDSAA
ncbi:MAG: hypothetical protein QOK42_1697 [Frankiaceae bacterium]|nr:hypothetical protein [Frankiaceae bacterium]MDX6225667.1 hypothetical protein [Frankiales bacterium]